MHGFNFVCNGMNICIGIRIRRGSIIDGIMIGGDGCGLDYLYWYIFINWYDQVWNFRILVVLYHSPQY